MTTRDNQLDSKDLEILKNLPNLADKINKNLQNIDIIINQRELNSSIGSVSSGNNPLRGLAHSKGKNRQVNIEDCIDIKNIVKTSVQGLNAIFDSEKKNDKINVKSPLTTASNGNLNSKENLSLSVNVPNNSINYLAKNNTKGKGINQGNNSKFEPIEEEINQGNNEYFTNNISKSIKNLDYFHYLKRFIF
jgi:hypothetical protein